MFGFTLSRLPWSGKVFCTLFLLGIGCGYVAAFVQAATAVGLSPEDVRSSLTADHAMTHLAKGERSAEREFRLEELGDQPKVRIRTPLLIQTSHTHLFSMTLVAGLLGLLFLFASLREGLKALILALPFVGTILDIGGMWLARFVWPPLSVLVILGGGLFALGYLLITGISLHQLWLRKEGTT
jgi:hypothetical protein